MQTQMFNIALPKPLVVRIDEVAKREYRNRSEFIREAVRVYLEDRNEWDKLFAFGRRQAKKLGITSEKDVDRIVAKARKGA